MSRTPPPPAAIRVTGLSKRYARYAQRRHFATLKSALLRGDLFRGLTAGDTVPALDDVSFTVARGAMVAIVGPNGSGKSTLLKCLAGILKPSSGTVEVDGRVAALLELGAGFHPEISGRENIVINGIMLGLGRRQIERRIDDIIRFAELEDFIDAPVKTYSSGMYVRLGFSVAVAVEPDVLIVDEVLAVGDEAFSHKCLDRFKDLKRRNRTVLLVTHSLDIAEQMADEVILLEDGRVSSRGAPREVIDRYRDHVARREAAQAAAGELGRNAEAGAAPEPRTAPEPEAAAASEAAATGDEPDEASDGASSEPDVWQPRRWGNSAVELTEVVLRGGDGEPANLFHTGDPLTLELAVRAHREQRDFVFGIGVWTRDGQLAYGTNTDIERYRPVRLAGDGRVRFTVPALVLLPGSYSVDVAVHSRDGVAYDYRRGALTFVVRSDVSDLGVARLEHGWQFGGGVELTSGDRSAAADDSAGADGRS